MFSCAATVLEGGLASAETLSPLKPAPKSPRNLLAAADNADDDGIDLAAEFSPMRVAVVDEDEEEEKKEEENEALDFLPKMGRTNGDGPDEHDDDDDGNRFAG